MAPTPVDLHKRVRLTHGQKLQICAKFRDNRRLTYNDLANWARGKFKLPSTSSKPTIGRSLKAESTLRQLPPDELEYKNARSKTQVAIDQCVVEFIAMCELEGLSLSGAMIMVKVVKIADRLRVPLRLRPRFGWAWLLHLEQRCGFRWRRAYGESASVDMTAVTAEMLQLRRVINTYRPSDVFNMDELAFFYNAVPRGSICIANAPVLKQNKARVAMALCANATGTEKAPVLFVGKAAAPRWLPNKSPKMQYAATNKAWMTTEVYQQWLLDFDQRVHQQGRKVLLLVDNTSAHFEDGLDLANVVVKKLPPNTTAKVQPMDQGAIYCVKRSILASKMEHALDNISSEKKKPYQLDLLRAMT